MTIPVHIRTQLQTISEDSTFCNVVRHGSWEATYRYADSRVEEIKSILRKRLQVQLGLQNIVMPQGSVYTATSLKKRRIEEQFTRGKTALQKEDYREAAGCFEASAHRVNGTDRDIANNYRAYALARLGEPLRARMILSPLRNDRFSFPSAYWNLACCMPPEQSAEQLAILADGLYSAPHPCLLNGAIHLGTMLGHKNLDQWLSCMPLTEAVLLSYYTKYERMDPEAKELGVLRLGAYVLLGEIKVPDPMQPVPQRTIQAFVNALFERLRHAEVMDFWLLCRRPLGRKRHDYWKIQADYLEQFGRRPEAVRAFRTELRCRLRLLDEVPHFRSNQAFLFSTRNRGHIFLRRCMSAKLHVQGLAIYGMLADFEEHRKLRLLPDDPKIDAHFAAKAVVLT